MSERERVCCTCGGSICHLPKISLVCFDPKEDSTKHMPDNLLQNVFYFLLRHSEDVFDTNKINSDSVQIHQENKTEGRVNVQFQLPFVFSFVSCDSCAVTFLCPGESENNMRIDKSTSPKSKCLIRGSTLRFALHWSQTSCHCHLRRHLKSNLLGQSRDGDYGTVYFHGYINTPGSHHIFFSFFFSFMSENQNIAEAWSYRATHGIFSLERL